MSLNYIFGYVIFYRLKVKKKFNKLNEHLTICKTQLFYIFNFIIDTKLMLTN